ncbi:S-layer homology domain-containing protein [Peptoniphilus sp. KCTC 25270]|uniref:S-layer homology domain-containing protein n=1 Tax=Peptoniphilus sp. KCTC 25270 TaxID=2897414 RepID=UPI001E2CD43E|nr:S-layer homology domain-containing protein [Peptoniphilus sp. KCTC 25270]MCD1147220.1 S-layer homology domain-containing protein [Peptoniphilus sp. KCTC 25270]
MKYLMNKKHVASLALAGVMLSSPIMVFAKQYSDVPASHWAYTHIQKLDDLKIVEGYVDGTYKPNRHVSYLEIIQLLKGVINPTAAEIQKAVSVNGYIANEYGVPEWAKEAVCVALAKGVITETNLKQAAIEGLVKNAPKDNEFPSRELITVYYARALGVQPSKDLSVLKYKDKATLGETKDAKIGNLNVAEYVSGMIQAGILADTGSDGNFEGKRPLRRAEMAKMTNLSYDYVANTQAIEGKVIYISNINGVNTVALTLKDGTSRAVALTDATVYTRGGKTVEKSTLQEGQQVRIKIYKEDKDVTTHSAKEVEILSVEMTGTGYVVSKDSEKVSLAYTTKADVILNDKIPTEQSGTFTWAKDAKITRYGETIKISDIGVKDILQFTADNGQITKANVIPEKAEVVGSDAFLSSASSATNSGTLTATLKNGEKAVFNVEGYQQYLKIWEDLNGLPKGAKIDIALKYDTVVLIRLHVENDTFSGIFVDVGKTANNGSYIIVKDFTGKERQVPFAKTSSNPKWGEVDMNEIYNKLSEPKYKNSYLELTTENGYVTGLQVLGYNYQSSTMKIRIVDKVGQDYWIPASYTAYIKDSTNPSEIGQTIKFSENNKLDLKVAEDYDLLVSKYQKENGDTVLSGYIGDKAVTILK